MHVVNAYELSLIFRKCELECPEHSMARCVFDGSNSFQTVYLQPTRLTKNICRTLTQGRRLVSSLQNQRSYPYSQGDLTWSYGFLLTSTSNPHPLLRSLQRHHNRQGKGGHHETPDPTPNASAVSQHRQLSSQKIKQVSPWQVSPPNPASFCLQDS